jgi:ATP-binding cassette, subfamily B, bacterial CvaB/MchF/RaxB
MQDDQLLSGSIEENISFFSQTPNQTHIRMCAEHASIAGDIGKMPMQYQTLIGDMGSSLSGGQKQRIVLARALYRNPQILFLDEATSHLDNRNEQLITDMVNAMDTTRIVITHRIEGVRTNYRRVTVDAGRLLTEFEHQLESDQRR